MSELKLIKSHGVLLAADDETADRIAHYLSGDLLIGTFRKVRNPKFHRKFFALLDVAYESWEPEPLASEFGAPQKNRELFREQVTILAGHYESSFSLDGSVRLRAKSISFAAMDDVAFGELYSAVADVILQKILINHSHADLDEQVDRILGFV